MSSSPHGYSISIWDGRESNKLPFLRTTGTLEVEFEAPNGLLGYLIKGPMLKNITVSTKEHYDENTPKKFLEALKSVGILEGESTYNIKETYVSGQRNNPTARVCKTEQITQPIYFDLPSKVKAESLTQKPVPVEMYQSIDLKDLAKLLEEGAIVEKEYVRQWVDFQEVFPMELNHDELRASLENKYPGNDILIDDSTTSVNIKPHKISGVPQTSKQYESLERFDGKFKRNIDSKTTTDIASGCDKNNRYNWHFLNYTTDLPLLDFISKKMEWEHEGVPLVFSEIVKQLTDIEKSRKI